MLPLCCALIAFFISHVGRAQEIVYDNTDPSRYLTNALPIYGEVGDEVNLSGIGRFITSIQFEYYGYWMPDANERVIARIYKNDGPSVDIFDSFAPKTLLWQSPGYTINPGPQRVSITNINVDVPSRFTFTLQFLGLTNSAGERAEVVLYDPPTIGWSYGDYWQRLGLNSFLWNIYLTPPIRDNFALRIWAAPTPRPALVVTPGSSSFALSWSGTGFRPQQSSDLINWRYVRAANTNAATVPIEAGLQFFRLHRPAEGEMSIERNTNQLDLSWIGTGYRLQWHTNLTATTGWQNVSTNLNSANMNIGTEAARFFRLRKIDGL